MTSARRSSALVDRAFLRGALLLALAGLLGAGCKSAVARLGMSTSPASRYRIDDDSLVAFLKERPGLRTREGEGYALHYHADMDVGTVFDVTQRVERARRAVSLALEREFEKPVSIYLPRPGSVSDSEMPIRRTNGFSATFGDEIFTLIRTPYPESTIRHELVHCMFNGMGRESSWIEEGLAEFVSTEDGRREGLREVLEARGCSSWRDLRQFRQGSDPSLRRRATAWLLVYVLHTHHGMSLAAIADADTLEDVTSPEEALEWLRYREPRPGPVDPLR